MALQIWLPLNGTLENKGCADAIITNNGASVDTFGKIGSCYSFNGSDNYISILCPKLYQIFSGGSQPFSTAMWFWSNDTGRAILFGDYNIVANNVGTISLELTATPVYRLWWNNNPNWQPSNAITENNKWTHVVCTYDGYQLKMYFNGNLIATRDGTLIALTKTTGDYRLGTDGRTGTTAFNGKLNDFRIYDHCLSAAEVHELSQGLVQHYKLNEIIDNIVYDCSGYGNNGEVYSGGESPIIIEGSPRYDNCLYFPTQLSSIKAGRGGMVTDAITVNIWAYVEETGTEAIVSCTQTGGWSINFVNKKLATYVFIVDNDDYLRYENIFDVNLNEWYMLTLVYDRIAQKSKTYVNGEKISEINGSIPNVIKYNSNNIVWIGAEATKNAINPETNKNMIGKVSDYRIYCTPFSDNDIKALYQTSAKIDKSGKLHNFELCETDKSSITKTGIIKYSQFYENTKLLKLKYDTNIYFEQDGSTWVRIFHHNNPSSLLFNSTDDFENSVYIDENRWFNIEVCNNMTNWEFIIKLKTTSDAEELKFRWIQQVNPMIATFEDVKAENVEYIISEGYSSSTYGGLYKKSGNTYLAANNGRANNWWGAIGSWSLSSGYLPGWQGKHITTGYEDIYLRIDNQYITNSLITKICKNKKIIANEFIER